MSITRNTVSDELAIRNLEARYCDAVNRRDVDAWANTWSRDAVWELMGKRVEGRENIVSTWQDTMVFFPIVFHSHLSGLVSLFGDIARCRWYVYELVVDHDQKAKCFFGIYHDECEYKEDEWLFNKRRFDLLYQGKGPLEPENWLGFPEQLNKSIDE